MDSKPAAKICFLALAVLLFLISGCEHEAGGLGPAPNFLLEDIVGNRVELDQYRGKVVLVDFWATWCPPCRKSIPELITLQDKYRDQGLVVLGISVDDPRRVSNKALSAFKESFKMNYIILRADARVARDWFGTEEMAIPTMFVVNGEGQIVNKHVGFNPGAVERSIKKLMS
jgi:cytochrome c biogenesis protein CcmG/thiol:disulfide interchange protein DsbE